ncbi:GNAT family N-acetyltransferase [Nitrospira sp. KM1]|uniref:GNAT family N-acetyltransferase n=1 Tax=Nitrospira sp. KM1 TaxID=1936990 RepID=UPI00156621DA|nr:GNAT family N-acetyltransferase [Nitrospira sp. KM1]
MKLVSGIFNESFGFRPDGKPYRMGPKSVTDRLLETEYLLVAGDEHSGIGYLFGKEIPSSQGRIAWIESMAVLPLYRRNGVATALVRYFYRLTKMAPRFGFATPNPIAALIATREIPGKMYLGSCYPPYTLKLLLKEIRQNCFDLRGCHIDEDHFRIRTGFSPLSRSDQREWSPREDFPEPAWWGEIQHLPNEFEALLVIER